MSQLPRGPADRPGGQGPASSPAPPDRAPWPGGPLPPPMAPAERSRTGAIPFAPAPDMGAPPSSASSRRSPGYPPSSPSSAIYTPPGPLDPYAPQGQPPGPGYAVAAPNAEPAYYVPPADPSQAPPGEFGYAPLSGVGHVGNGYGQTGAAPATSTGAYARAPGPGEVLASSANVVRTHSYAFVLDQRGLPVEIGSGRFAKAFLGEERWLESKTDFRRQVVIKVLQRGVEEDDRMRFQLEKELLERVQGHPSIIALHASGESDDPEFIPASIRDKVENDFVVLEQLDMSLEERLKGSRQRGKREDLLALEARERLFRVLDYMIPVASAVEYAHLIRNITHRDIKPANILIRLPDERLRGSTLEVRLADFNVAKLKDEEINFGMTRLRSVPGTLFFQSPEQETNIIELLVNVQQGVADVEFFEDFYINIAENDTFSLFNRDEQYTVMYADRTKKRIVLDRPYREAGEVNVRARIQKSVGRPADIYSLGALFYYLISGAYANPKTLYDAFHKFIEYEKVDENNTVDAYLDHEYSVINSLRAPKSPDGTAEVAPVDRFFSYKHYLDGNGELVDQNVMKIIAKCMIRNKPDSYCRPHEVDTRGISDLVRDLIDLYAVIGVDPAARPAQLARRGGSHAGRGLFGRWLERTANRLHWFWLGVKAKLRGR